MCLVLIAQMCTKCGFCMLGADNSDVYKFRRCKHTAFSLKSLKERGVGISVVAWKHINAFFSVHFSLKCLAK